MTNSIVSNFVPYNNDGLQLFVDTTTGLAYASIRSMARMLGINPGTVKRELVNSVADYPVINAQIQTSQGLRIVALYSSDVVFKLAFK